MCDEAATDKYYGAFAFGNSGPIWIRSAMLCNAAD